MSQVSTVRLYVLRAGYLLITVGLAFMIWPGIIDHPTDLPHMNGVVRSMLGAVSLLAIVGMRYPLQMLPVMFFELFWKVIWLIAFGIPLWNSGGLDEDRSSTLSDCAFGVVVVLIVVPWGYVFDHYLKRSGDRWRGGISESPTDERSN